MNVESPVPGSSSTIRAPDLLAPIATPRPARPLTRRELGWAALGCALVVSLFLSPALFTGRVLSPADLLYDYQPWTALRPAGWSGPSNNQLSDSALVLEPYLEYNARQVQSGALPLWNPNNMLGAPLIGNMQSAVFFPLNWPQFLWPGGAMRVVSAWLRLFLALLGMYGLARDVVRVGPVAAGVAALTFGLGAYMVVWLLYPLASAALWLPWLWWATARLIAQPGPRRIAVLAAGVALGLLAGHPETIFYVALATGLFAGFQVWEYRARSWRQTAAAGGGWIAAFLLGAGIAAIQLLPFVEYLGASAAFTRRLDHGVASFWLPFHYAWTLISPDLYGNTAHHNWWDTVTNYNESNTYVGILPLLLAPFALFVAAPAQRRLLGFLGGVLVLALGVVYHWPVIYDMLAALPVLQVSANQRLLLIIQFALGLLAALGVEAIDQRLPRSRGRLLGGLGLGTGGLLRGGVGCAWVFRHGYFHVPVDSEQANAVWQAGLGRAVVWIVISAALLALLLILGGARPRLARLLLALLPLVLLADLWQARGDFNPTVAPANYYPDTPVTRFLQQQPGLFRTFATGWVFMPNTNLPYDLADVRGYDSLEPALYADLMARIDPSQTIFLTGGFRPFQTIQSRVINVLNVRYILAAPGDDPNYLAIAQQDQNTDVVPEIIGSRHPGQTFVAHRDNLAQIQVLGATYGRRPGGRLIFHLQTAPGAPADLVTQELDTSRLPDNAYWTISFPPIAQSNNRSFYFYFEAVDAAAGQGATLWYSQADGYTEGTRLQNGQPAPGDLAFRALARLDLGTPWFVRVLDGGAQGLSIFENRQAQPRAWLTHRVQVEPNGPRRLLVLRNPDFDRNGTALLSAPPPPDLALPSAPPPAGADTVTITHYAAEAVTITTHSPAPGLLILADQVFPGWEAQVDGRPAPILTADYALRAVAVPAGDHTVQFAYHPLSVTLGALGTGAGLLLLLFLVAWPWRRRRVASSE